MTMLAEMPHTGDVKLYTVAVCHGCKKQHKETVGVVPGPGRMSLDAARLEWRSKHSRPDCDVEFFVSERRLPKGLDDSQYEKEGRAPWWLDYSENANVKLSYVASSAVTFTSTVSLASSSTKLAGAESAAVDNSSNLYIDYLLAGIIRYGTTPTTAKSLDICVVGTLADALWPDVFDGTDSAETVTTQEMKDQCCKPFATQQVIATTSNADAPYGPGSVASRFGGVVPLKWVIFVTHDMVAALNGTQGNPAHITPSYLTVA